MQSRCLLCFRAVWQFCAQIVRFSGFESIRYNFLLYIAATHCFRLQLINIIHKYSLIYSYTSFHVSARALGVKCRNRAFDDFCKWPPEKTCNGRVLGSSTQCIFWREKKSYFYVCNPFPNWYGMPTEYSSFYHSVGENSQVSILVGKLVVCTLSP